MTRLKTELDRALTWFCVVLLGLLVVDVTWQVFARQVLNDPSGWSQELATYLFIWLGLFGSALVFGERGHIAVDLVVRKLPVPAARVVAILVQLVILVFAGLVLVYGGWMVAELTWEQKVTGLPVNVGWLYTALPISGVLVVLYTLYHLGAIASRAERPVDEPDADVI